MLFRHDTNGEEREGKLIKELTEVVRRSRDTTLPVDIVYGAEMELY